MKTRLLPIFVIAALMSPFVWSDQVYASCIADNQINWDSVMSESEFVFTGTVPVWIIMTAHNESLSLFMM